LILTCTEAITLYVMKTLRILLPFIILFPFFTQGQPTPDDRQKPIGYFTISPAIAKSVGEFATNLNKKILWSFNFDVVFRPFKKVRFWEPGVQFDFNFLRNRKDRWNGIELKTQGLIAKINLINRIRPFKGQRIEPFLDLTYGLNISTTSTDYEVVDKATFVESFFFDIEDEIETVSVKSFTDASYVIGLGAGIIIKELYMIQLRYNYSPEIEFINRENVVINADGSVGYTPSKSKMETLNLSVGITFEKLLRNAQQSAPEDSQ
jgi:hypothetical protein